MTQPGSRGIYLITRRVAAQIILSLVGWALAHADSILSR